MKILLVHYRYFISGGPERYLFNVQEALTTVGHKVIPFSIHTLKNQGTIYENFFTPNIANSDEVLVDKYPKNVKTYLDLIAREFYSFKVKRKLKKLIQQEHPDICYLLAYKRALSYSVIDACFEMKLPIVNRLSDYNMVCGAASLYRDGNFCDSCIVNGDFECVKNKCVKHKSSFSWMRWFSIKFSKMILFDRKINRFVCTNQFMKNMMIRAGFHSERIDVLPTFFHETPQVRAFSKSNEYAEKVKFLFIGNMDELKGIYDLLDALALLKNEVSNFHLTIVGGLRDYENKKIHKLILNKNLSSYITKQPFEYDGSVFQYYLYTNVTIIPARWVENLPNILIESLYFHRPVVVPNYGSFEYTTDDTIAFRYDALSVNSLFKQLLAICQNPNLIQKKSLNCENFFLNNYSEKNHIEKLLGLFNSTIDKVNVNENF